jgi:hypothetical protein
MSGAVSNLTPAIIPVSVLLPDGTAIHSTHTGYLNLPQLPVAARLCHLFPHLTTGSLLSVGQLCDHGCTAVFTQTDLRIHLDGQLLLYGTRQPPFGHWICQVPTHGTASATYQSAAPCTTPITGHYAANHVCPITTSTDGPGHIAIPDPDCSTVPHPIHITDPIPSMNAILPTNLIADRVAFYHAALFSPVMSTWCTAIDAGHLATFPDLTSAQVKRHFPVSIPLQYGHMDQTRANQQSTVPKPIPDSPPDSRPTPITDRTNTIFVDVHHVTGKLSSDQTGRFPTTSTSGHNYLMVVYEYDANFIHAEPLKSRSGPTILAAYQHVHQLFTNRGFKPKLQRLDNEASTALLAYMAEQEVDVQLSPPHVHRRNAAERAIRTFKNHLIAGLSSVDPDFPMNLWDRLLPQAIQTLNLLRSSRLHPQLSAYAHVHGLFDYNRTPIAPPGIRVLVHDKPSVRGTWAPHALPGWYLGPALNHYRCYRVYVRATRHERITDTLAWLPTNVPLPVPTALD